MIHIISSNGSQPYILLNFTFNLIDILTGLSSSTDSYIAVPLPSYSQGYKEERILCRSLILSFSNSKSPVHPCTSLDVSLPILMQCSGTPLLRRDFHIAFLGTSSPDRRRLRANPFAPPYTSLTSAKCEDWFHGWSSGNESKLVVSNNYHSFSV